VLLFLVYNLHFLAGLRELFSQTDERGAPPRIAVMANMASASAPSKKNVKVPESSVHPTPPSLDQINAASRHSVMDEDTDDDEEFPIAEEEQEVRFMLVP
jgi:hypothetical protein